MSQNTIKIYYCLVVVMQGYCFNADIAPPELCQVYYTSIALLIENTFYDYID